MIFDATLAAETAENLLQIKAIKLSPKNPFNWASGWKSPIYCDNRITLSHVSIRNFLRSNIANIVTDKYGKPDAIAGVATGAIAIGVLVAQELGLPFIYVRPEAKKHGRQNQIEGQISPGQTVVVIEDLISTGMSSLNAVKALEAENITVKGMIAIFSYGFSFADENFKQADVELTTLSDYAHLITQANHTHYIGESDLETLERWRANPSEWDV